MLIDVSFRVMGNSIPLDHGYALYSTLSALFPELHTADWLAIHPISGFPLGGKSLQITNGSRLRLRIPHERLVEVIPLAGKQLVLANASNHFAIRLGVPEVYTLHPSPLLASRCVVIKVSEAEKSHRSPDREMFLVAIKTQMTEQGIEGDAWIDDRRDSRGRELSRRIMRLKGKSIVGYSVRVSGLSDEDSLKLQEVGLGGRRRMGCGIFVPVRTRGE
jgi:CRISPR-associated protein Cas6